MFSSADIINSVQTLGAPMIFVGLLFWFIQYHYDQNSKEKTAYIKSDEANDKRAFALAEKSNEAMNKLYIGGSKYKSSVLNGQFIED